MSDLKKQLRPHATTCIKKAIAESFPYNPAYTVVCDHAGCYADEKLIKNYTCVVNIRRDGDRAGRAIQKTLADKSVVCATQNILRLEVQIYAIQCDNPADTAWAVLASIQSHLEPCDGNYNNFFAKRISYVSGSDETDAEFATKITRLSASFDVQYDFVPCRASLVFNNYTGATTNVSGF